MRFPVPIEEHKPLHTLTTWGIGGPARYFAEITSIPDMESLLAFCYQHEMRYMVLGKGSNCLFDDRGYDGLIILNKIDFLNRSSQEVHVGAGFSFSRLGAYTARQGLSGLEFASGIPGSVGGAVYMNAGANGQETADHLESVNYVTYEGVHTDLARASLTFGYRTSSFQQMRGAIVGATFKLVLNSSARAKQLDLIAYRTSTQPYSALSAGCVFRNPPDNSAGRIIESCGLKGCAIGGAKVSELHANFIINTGRATAQEILTLIKTVQTKVKEERDIDLQPEVCFIPYQEAYVVPC